MSTLTDAQHHLTALAGPSALLRDDQATAIAALVDDQARTLVVQRTGWGKSAVYFVATRLLRDAGAGPTVIVSPLLALMRDQLAAARRMGLTAETINSTNVDDWHDIEARIQDGAIDLVLVSPERLAHPRFRERILDRLVSHIGMLVIDEAHCISDHGHDFRPDYRRLRDVLDQLASARRHAVPVLACTATATDRVVDDVRDQLARLPDGGEADVVVLRGPLTRDTLLLHVVRLDAHEDRLAWLGVFLERHATHGRAGIVYTLTVAEAERTAEFLRSIGHDVVAYTSRLDADARARVEADLKANDVAAVVATTALSMGYDKPDLGFVVHLGAPSSPVAYYQAIGRAGRGGHDAEVVCLPTGLDERLWQHFDVAGVPTEHEVDAILAALHTDRATSLPALETTVNLRRTRLELLLKVLDVDGPVERVEGGYRATGQPYHHDHERYRRLLDGRRSEHEVMRRYLAVDPGSCRMQLLTAALDDPSAAPCGRCDVCTGTPLDLPIAADQRERAADHLRSRDVLVIPRRRWPTGLPALGHDRRGNIPREQQAQEGRALADAEASGWSTLVTPLLAAARDGTWSPDDPQISRTVDALVAVLARWDWRSRPEAIVTVPSRRYGELVGHLADRVGELGRLPVHHDVVQRRDDRPAQAAMDNSAHQAANALANTTLGTEPPRGTVLLFDALRDSGWTLTVATHLLTEAGTRSVLPLVLHAGPVE